MSEKGLTYTQRQNLKDNVTPTPKSKDKKTNKDFQKIFFDKIDYLIQLNKKSPEALNIYMLFMKYAESNNTVYLTVDMIMKTLHICKQTVISALELLKQDGYMTTYKHGKVNFYFLNPDISVSCIVPYQRKIKDAYIKKVEKDLKDYEIAMKDLIGLDEEDEDYIKGIKEANEMAKRLTNELCEIDKTKVDTEIIDKSDRLRLKISFYNSHLELHAPTEEEIEQQKKDDEFNDDTLKPNGDLKESLS